jgi:hypothetical protein
MADVIEHERASDVIDYLEMTVRARRVLADDMRPSYEQFVLDNGESYSVLGDPVEPMNPGECFKNCALTALANPNFTYVEGWATSVIPLHHAWLLDENGTVVDPTWGHRPGTQYFGVEFADYEVLDTIERSDYGFSMLYPMSGGHPLLAAEEHEQQ